MVPALGCPWTVEVIRIQVDGIEIVGTPAKVEVLENLSGGGESSGKQKPVVW